MSMYANNINLQIVGMNWIEIEKAQYQIRPENSKISTCQIEIDTT